MPYIDALSLQSVNTKADNTGYYDKKVTYLQGKAQSSINNRLHNIKRLKVVSKEDFSAMLNDLSKVLDPDSRTNTLYFVTSEEAVELYINGVKVFYTSSYDTLIAIFNFSRFEWG